MAIQNESGPVCRKDGNVTGVVETSQTPASVNSSALPFEGHQASLSITRLLVCYVLQHWVWVCALLSLLHFTVASTALNLAPSLASLVYALLLRPWPPRWHARRGVRRLLNGRTERRRVAALRAPPKLFVTVERHPFRVELGIVVRPRNGRRCPVRRHAAVDAGVRGRMRAGRWPSGRRSQPQ